MPDASSFDTGAGQIQTLIATLQATNTRLSLLFEALLGGPTVNQLLGPGVSLYQAISKVGGGGILGVSDGSNAAPGFVGEWLTNGASGIAMVNATPTMIVSLPLTAGDWGVWGMVTFNPTASATLMSAGIGPTASAFTPFIGNDNSSQAGITVAGLGATTLALSPTRWSLAAAATAYLNAQANFASGTCSGTAKLNARRMR